MSVGENIRHKGGHVIRIIRRLYKRIKQSQKAKKILDTTRRK